MRSSGGSAPRRAIEMLASLKAQAARRAASALALRYVAKNGSEKCCNATRHIAALLEKVFEARTTRGVIATSRATLQAGHILSGMTILPFTMGGVMKLLMLARSLGERPSATASSAMPLGALPLARGLRHPVPKNVAAPQCIF